MQPNENWGTGQHTIPLTSALIATYKASRSPCISAKMRPLKTLRQEPFQALQNQ